MRLGFGGLGLGQGGRVQEGKLYRVVVVLCCKPFSSNVYKSPRRPVLYIRPGRGMSDCSPEPSTLAGLEGLVVVA